LIETREPPAASLERCPARSPRFFGRFGGNQALSELGGGSFRASEVAAVKSNWASNSSDVQSSGLMIRFKLILHHFLKFWQAEISEISWDFWTA
jgi:hypothetical protein